MEISNISDTVKEFRTEIYFGYAELFYVTIQCLICSVGVTGNIMYVIKCDNKYIKSAKRTASMKLLLFILSLFNILLLLLEIITLFGIVVEALSDSILCSVILILRDTFVWGIFYVLFFLARDSYLVSKDLQRSCETKKYRMILEAVFFWSTYAVFLCISILYPKYSCLPMSPQLACVLLLTIACTAFFSAKAHLNLKKFSGTAALNCENHDYSLVKRCIVTCWTYLFCWMFTVVIIFVQILNIYIPDHLAIIQYSFLLSTTLSCAVFPITHTLHKSFSSPNLTPLEQELRLMPS